MGNKQGGSGKATTPKGSGKADKAVKAEWQKQGSIKAPKNSSFAQPLYNAAKAEIIFVCSRDNEPSLFLKTLNLQNGKYGKKIKLECSTAINVADCVCTLNEKNQCIYLIHDNKTVMRIDLTTKAISPITTISTRTESCSRAQIHAVEDKIYLLGAEQQDEKSQDVDANLVCVAYDAYTVDEDDDDDKEEVQTNFGSLASTLTLTVGDKTTILLIGGESEHWNKDNSASVRAPHNVIWGLLLHSLNKPGLVSKKFEDGTKWCRRFLPSRLTSFGVINYRDQYLVVFGGHRYDQEQGKSAYSDRVYVLDLHDGEWYEWKQRLPRKSGYFAVYQQRKDMVHVFSYHGEHYALSMNVIVKAVESKQCTHITSWAIGGKTMVPIKTTSIKNLGPKIEDGDDSDNDDEE